MYSEIQRTIREYWAISAPKFSDLVITAPTDDCSRTWAEKIMSHAPVKKTMDILDVGTGPGFFPITLSGEGRRITAIDCTEEMLKEARANAAYAGIDARFILMDAHALDFPDESFDLIVSRNVVWTLYDPLRAYVEWKRVLRPGGKMLIFDANYGAYCFDEKIAEQKKRDEEKYRKVYGEPPKTNIVSGEYIERMFLSDKKRPEWDIDTLLSLGMDVYAETDVSPELRSEKYRLLNSTTPLFMVTAERIG
jgi:ubiquinone/menaquinone biosynthesis C-methylase UbiE